MQSRPNDSLELTGGRRSYCGQSCALAAPQLSSGVRRTPASHHVNYFSCSFVGCFSVSHCYSSPDRCRSVSQPVLDYEPTGSAAAPVLRSRKPAATGAFDMTNHVAPPRVAPVTLGKPWFRRIRQSRPPRYSIAPCESIGQLPRRAVRVSARNSRGSRSAKALDRSKCLPCPQRYGRTVLALSEDALRAIRRGRRRAIRFRARRVASVAIRCADA